MTLTILCIVCAGLIAFQLFIFEGVEQGFCFLGGAAFGAVIFSAAALQRLPKTPRDPRDPTQEEWRG